MWHTFVVRRLSSGFSHSISREVLNHMTVRGRGILTGRRVGEWGVGGGGGSKNQGDRG